MKYRRWKKIRNLRDKEEPLPKATIPMAQKKGSMSAAAITLLLHKITAKRRVDVVGATGNVYTLLNVRDRTEAAVIASNHECEHEKCCVWPAFSEYGTVKSHAIASCQIADILPDMPPEPPIPGGG